MTLLHQVSDSLMKKAGILSGPIVNLVFFLAAFGDNGKIMEHVDRIIWDITITGGMSVTV